MILTKTKYKTFRIKIEDGDDYDVTDDSGVIFRPTAAQLKRIAKAAYAMDNEVLLS